MDDELAFRYRRRHGDLGHGAQRLYGAGREAGLSERPEPHVGGPEQVGRGTPERGIGCGGR